MYVPPFVLVSPEPPYLSLKPFDKMSIGSAPPAVTISALERFANKSLSAAVYVLRDVSTKTQLPDAPVSLIIT